MNDKYILTIEGMSFEQAQTTWAFLTGHSVEQMSGGPGLSWSGGFKIAFTSDWDHLTVKIDPVGEKNA